MSVRALSFYLGVSLLRRVGHYVASPKACMELSLIYPPLEGEGGGIIPGTINRNTHIFIFNYSIFQTMAGKILFTMLVGFLVISFLAHLGTVKTKNKILIGLIVLAYPIALYYLFYFVEVFQNNMESKGAFVYIDHDGIINSLIILVLWAIAFINLAISLYRRYRPIGNNHNS
jgi:hypothetical protein